MIDMEYDVFEYSLLKRLSDTFQIKECTIYVDKPYIIKKQKDEFGMKCDVNMVEVVVDNVIKIDFEDDFSIAIGRDFLMRECKRGHTVSDIGERLEKYIENEWLKRIKK